jgi:putative membrane protein
MSHPDLAAPGHRPSLAELLGAWTWDPLVIAVLVASATLYTAGAVRMARRAGAGLIAPRQALAHGAGLAVLAVALISPLDRASDALFSAHMVQHELLMLVAAPLIVLGRPAAPVLWAMPRRWRVRARRAARRPALVGTWRALTAPAVALVLHAAARWLWHIPSAFEIALAHEAIHALQHATFFGTAVLFWWTLIHGRYGRAGYGVAVLFVFLTMLHSGLLAALLGLADHPLYASHAARTAGWGLDPTQDQQRAGLFMWIPAGVAMTAIGLALLGAWLGQSARAIRGSAHPGLAGQEPACRES